MSFGRLSSDSMPSADIERVQCGSLREAVDFGTRWVPNHGAAANGLSAVRSMDGRLSGRRERPIHGHAAVADLIR